MAMSDQIHAAMTSMEGRNGAVLTIDVPAKLRGQLRQSSLSSIIDGCLIYEDQLRRQLNVRLSSQNSRRG